MQINLMFFDGQIFKIQFSVLFHKFNTNAQKKSKIGNEPCEPLNKNNTAN